MRTSVPQLYPSFPAHLPVSGVWRASPCPPMTTWRAFGTEDARKNQGDPHSSRPLSFRALGERIALNRASFLLSLGMRFSV